MMKEFVEVQHLRAAPRAPILQSTPNSLKQERRNEIYFKKASKRKVFKVDPLECSVLYQPAQYKSRDYLETKMEKK